MFDWIITLRLIFIKTKKDKLIEDAKKGNVGLTVFTIKFQELNTKQQKLLNYYKW